MEGRRCFIVAYINPVVSLERREVLLASEELAELARYVTIHLHLICGGYDLIHILCGTRTWWES